jgi:hypothetical protein
MHSRGHRASHHHLDLPVCEICLRLPSRVRCSFTDGKFCFDCFSNRHLKTLPIEGKLKPPCTLQIPDLEFPGFVSPRLNSSDWHLFSESTGDKYLYNFGTREKRRPKGHRNLSWNPMDTLP